MKQGKSHCAASVHRIKSRGDVFRQVLSSYATETNSAYRLSVAGKFIKVTPEL